MEEPLDFFCWRSGPVHRECSSLFVCRESLNVPSITSITLTAWGEPSRNGRLNSPMNTVAPAILISLIGTMAALHARLCLKAQYRSASSGNASSHVAFMPGMFASSDITL
jgi:hypothetical protein